MKTVTGYLVDPEARTVTAVDVSVEDDGSCLKDLYRHTQCDCIDLVTFNRFGDGVFVDDNGLLKDPEYFFSIDGYPDKLAGRGLVLGVDRRGETTSPKESLDSVKRRVRYYAIVFNALIEQMGTPDTTA